MTTTDQVEKRTKENAAQVLDQALAQASSATTLDELRRSLSVTLTVKAGLTLEEVGQLIGRSTAWVSKARKDFVVNGVMRNSGNHGGRRNQIFPEKREEELMDVACKNYRIMSSCRFWDHGFDHEDIQVHRFVKLLLEKQAGRPVSTSTAFAVMARVGKKKFPNYTAGCWAEYSRKFKT